MLMPIVSMNKMAMNESVAASCCFQEVASPTNVYWEVLNGGWIGSGFVETKNWRDGAFRDYWSKLGYDINLGDTGTLANLATFRAANFPGGWAVRVAYTDGVVGLAPWWAHLNDASVWPGGLPTPLLNGADPDYAYISINEWFEHTTYSRGDSCSHDSAGCRYLSFDIAHLANRHWDSTRSHGTPTPITDWAKPHAAQRFHS